MAVNDSRPNAFGLFWSASSNIQIFTISAISACKATRRWRKLRMVRNVWCHGITAVVELFVVYTWRRVDFTTCKLIYN